VTQKPSKSSRNLHIFSDTLKVALAQAWPTSPVRHSSPLHYVSQALAQPLFFLVCS